MPVKIPDGLPAGKILEAEHIYVIPESRAFTQDIRPLQVLIVNLMPTKVATETQLLRLLSNSPLQVAPTFLHPQSHTPKNTSPEYLARFYKNLDEIQTKRYDCLIITGAPVETISFAEVAYWDELRELMDWSRSHVYSSLHLCWGAQAGLYHHFGVDKHLLPEKLFGVFTHTVSSHSSALLRGFDDVFFAPHSRYTEVLRKDILKVQSLRILSESEVAGVYVVSTKDDRQVFVTGHPEYDHFTLKVEYERDKAKGLPTSLPVNYFPGDDLSQPPLVCWRAHASLFFTNWLNDVYQKTPFNLEDLKLL